LAPNLLVNSVVKLTRIVIHCISAGCLAITALAQTPTPDEPITAGERLTWFAKGTVGPASLVGGAISAGFGTWTNQPKEYGTHWDGFGARYGMRLTGLATSNAVEASLGAVWGEDPRYYRAGGNARFGGRVGHVIKWTFVAPDRNGALRPAYARYIAITGNNFLSNTWREQSEANTSHALERTALGFLSRMAGNTFDEFWPDVKQKVFHRH
jgi:hypothetical protein